MDFRITADFVLSRRDRRGGLGGGGGGGGADDAGFTLFSW
jgi:hypothetical protein